jgi:UDP-3-O-[3-hydroxymyristoyl] glucosamine N-acyltransferase
VTIASAYSLLELAQRLELELIGDPAQIVTGIATLEKAVPGQLSFFHNPAYRSQLLVTRASAVILSKEHAALCPTACLVTANPYLAYAKASSLFSNASGEHTTSHASAQIHPSAQVDSSAILAANVIVGANTVIDRGVRVGANSVIGSACHLGEDTRLYANVTSAKIPSCMQMLLCTVM